MTDRKALLAAIAGCERAHALGCELLRGYVYRVVAESGGSWDCSREFGLDDGSTHTEYCRFGYHGDDVPPCGADYLCDDADTDSYLVISSADDPTEIDTVDGFTLEPVTLDRDWSYDDGAWAVRVVNNPRDHDPLTTLCGIS